MYMNYIKLSSIWITPIYHTQTNQHNVMHISQSYINEMGKKESWHSLLTIFIYLNNIIIIL